MSAEWDEGTAYVLWRLRNCFSPWIVAMRQQCMMSRTEEDYFVKAFMSAADRATAWAQANGKEHEWTNRLSDWYRDPPFGPPRGGDAAEEELGALLERLSIQGGVSFMRWESDHLTHAESAEIEVLAATPLAALRALDAALAEQQQKNKEAPAT